MRAVDHLRDIIGALKFYAAEHDGKYPEGATSNDALRELYKAGFFDDERCFTVENSPYVGDNDLGEAPGYLKALQPGENHWAMTRGLTDSLHGDWPLMFENPARASWPPYWDSRFVDIAKPGRIQEGWKIIVGRNDGSIMAERLTMKNEPLVTLKPTPMRVPDGATWGTVNDGKNLFEHAGPHEIMDVAR